MSFWSYLDRRIKDGSDGGLSLEVLALGNAED
jgi:hypothetical protein